MKFDIRNLEKYAMVGAFLLITLAIIYKFIQTNVGNPEMIYFSLGVASIAITRKGLSYFKPSSYIGGTEVATDPSSSNTTPTINVVTPSTSTEQQKY